MKCRSNRREPIRARLNDRCSRDRCCSYSGIHAPPAGNAQTRVQG